MKGLTANCKECNKSFIKKKDSQRYCSTACRVKAYRKRHGLGDPDWDGMKRRNVGDKLIRRHKDLMLELLEVEDKKAAIDNAGNDFNTIAFYITEICKNEQGKSWKCYFTEGESLQFNEFLSQQEIKINLKNLSMFNLAKFNTFFRHLSYTSKMTNLISEWNELIQDLSIQGARFNESYRLRKAQIQTAISVITGQKPPTNATEPKTGVEAITGTLSDRIQITTGRELSQHTPQAQMVLPAPYNALLGNNLPTNFYALVWGDSGSGKSTLGLHLLKALSRYASVGFLNAETALNQESPIYRLTLQTNTDDIPLVAIPTIQDLNRVLGADMFQFVVIDSVSRLGLTPQEVLNLRRLHPDRAIIGLMESNKEGKVFKGENEWKHHANIMIKAEKVMNEAGRVGAKYTVEKNQYGADGNSVTIKF